MRLRFVTLEGRKNEVLLSVCVVLWVVLGVLRLFWCCWVDLIGVGVGAVGRDCI